MYFIKGSSVSQFMGKIKYKIYGEKDNLLLWQWKIAKKDSWIKDFLEYIS